MWIDKKVLADLKERLEVLERRDRDRVYRDYFTVYEKLSNTVQYTIVTDNMGNSWGQKPYPRNKELSVKDVVELILKHLGVELTYKEDKPAAVELEKLHVAKHPRG